MARIVLWYTLPQTAIPLFTTNDAPQILYISAGLFANLFISFDGLRIPDIKSQKLASGYL